MKCWIILAILLALLGSTTIGVASGPWATLANGHFLYKRANDGDSFHISVAGKEYIFRLYFVDAPETTAEFRDRVEEQAKYFGITVEQNTAVGELAKAFTRERLTRSFVVRTCWQDAMGRSRLQRFYAFVQTSDGDLGEELVENGLARIHGTQSSPEGVTSARREWQRLALLQQKAKRDKVGGWGVNLGRMNVRADNPESAKGVDPFDAFFHPEKVAAAKTANAENAVSPVPTSPSPDISPGTSAPHPIDPKIAFSETKLDVNTASEAELENIPGIGSAIAQRIMAARPFTTADDLKNVKGIGSGKKYEKVRPCFR